MVFLAVRYPEYRHVSALETLPFSKHTVGPDRPSLFLFQMAELFDLK